MVGGVLLLAHGSKQEDANRFVKEKAELVERETGKPVEPCFLMFKDPGIETAFGKLVSRGVDSVTVVPFFMSPGKHVNEDIPEMVGKIREENPEVVINLSEAVGTHPKINEILVERTK